jgi:hypothetical protein
MKDQFIVGFSAGAVGGIFATLLSYPFYIFKLANRRLLDYAAALILGKLPHGILEIIFGELIHWGFSGAVGVLFAYLVNHKVITSKKLWLKGWAFGLGLWFLINILTTINKVENLTVVSVRTAIINAVASSIFGIIMAIVFNWINNKEKVVQD